MNEENSNSRTVYINKKDVNLEDAYNANLLLLLEKSIDMQNRMAL